MDLPLLQRLAPLLHQALAGQRVKALSAAGRTGALLRLASGKRLLLSWDPARPGAFLVPEGADLTEGETPFTGALAARLAGAALAEVALPDPAERVLRLSFTAGWPRKGEGPCLLLEAMGRRSNLLLVEPRRGSRYRILASARALSPAANPARPMRLGGEYLPPPPPSAPRPRRGAPPLGDLAELARVAWAWRGERPSPSPPPDEGSPTSLAGPLRRLRERIARELARLREEEERCRGFERVRLMGEALLLHLREVPPGADRVSLPHPGHPGSALEVPLDPSLSASGNANRLFERARRLQRGLSGTERLRREAVGALAAAEEAEGALAKGEEGPARALLGLRPAPGGGPGDGESPSPAAWKGPGWRHERGGFLILVGRGPADNERVTFEAAGPDDLWLHARDYPSSHVVILAGGRPVPEDVVRHAAALCAGRSGARRDSAVEVTVAERKWVRKPKGAKPGLVTVSRSRTVLARRKKGEEWPG